MYEYGDHIRLLYVAKHVPNFSVISLQSSNTSSFSQSERQLRKYHAKPPEGLSFLDKTGYSILLGMYWQYDLSSPVKQQQSPFPKQR